jgi:hypothetical protein
VLSRPTNISAKPPGLDRFGRIVEQKWTDGAGATTLDHFSYTYDRNGNRLTKTNQLASALGESYRYDGLNRGTLMQLRKIDESWRIAGISAGAGMAPIMDALARTMNQFADDFPQSQFRTPAEAVKELNARLAQLNREI